MTRPSAPGPGVSLQQVLTKPSRSRPFSSLVSSWDTRPTAPRPSRDQSVQAARFCRCLGDAFAFSTAAVAFDLRIPTCILTDRVVREVPELARGGEARVADGAGPACQSGPDWSRQGPERSDA